MSFLLHWLTARTCPLDPSTIASELLARQNEDEDKGEVLSDRRLLAPRIKTAHKGGGLVSR
jgi:hypothetical protein